MLSTLLHCYKKDKDNGVLLNKLTGCKYHNLTHYEYLDRFQLVSSRSKDVLSIVDRKSGKRFQDIHLGQSGGDLGRDFRANPFHLDPVNQIDFDSVYIIDQKPDEKNVLCEYNFEKRQWNNPYKLEIHNKKPIRSPEIIDEDIFINGITNIIILERESDKKRIVLCGDTHGDGSLHDKGQDLEYLLNMVKNSTIPVDIMLERDLHFSKQPFKEFKSKNDKPQKIPGQGVYGAKNAMHTTEEFFQIKPNLNNLHRIHDIDTRGYLNRVMAPASVFQIAMFYSTLFDDDGYIRDEVLCDKRYNNPFYHLGLNQLITRDLNWVNLEPYEFKIDDIEYLIPNIGLIKKQLLKVNKDDQKIFAERVNNLIRGVQIRQSATHKNIPSIEDMIYLNMHLLLSNINNTSGLIQTTPLMDYYTLLRMLKSYVNSVFYVAGTAHVQNMFQQLIKHNFETIYESNPSINLQSQYMTIPDDDSNSYLINLKSYSNHSMIEWSIYKCYFKSLEANSKFDLYLPHPFYIINNSLNKKTTSTNLSCGIYIITISAKNTITNSESYDYFELNVIRNEPHRVSSSDLKYKLDQFKNTYISENPVSSIQEDMNIPVENFVNIKGMPKDIF